MLKSITLHAVNVLVLSFVNSHFTGFPFLRILLCTFLVESLRVWADLPGPTLVLFHVALLRILASR